MILCVCFYKKILRPYMNYKSIFVSLCFFSIVVVNSLYGMKAKSQEHGTKKFFEGIVTKVCEEQVAEFPQDLKNIIFHHYCDGPLRWQTTGSYAGNYGQHTITDIVLSKKNDYVMCAQKDNFVSVFPITRDSFCFLYGYW